MIGNRPAGSPVRALRGRTWALPLLVAAVLGGLLAMHGLGPGHAPEPHGHRTSAAETADAKGGGHVHTRAQTAAEAAGPGHPHGHGSPPPSGNREYAEDCECGGADGHMSHADATCAAGGTSGAPAMDGPAASGATGPRPVTGFEGCWSRTGGERAPPSLHRLQLLRI